VDHSGPASDWKTIFTPKGRQLRSASRVSERPIFVAVELFVAI
jgi:hypothetical protein